MEFRNCIPPSRFVLFSLCRFSRRINKCIMICYLWLQYVSLSLSSGFIRLYAEYRTALAMVINERYEFFKEYKNWSKMHRAIFNNMLMVLGRMNERTKELLPLSMLLLWRLWLNVHMNFDMGKILSSFRFTKPRKSNFIWPISQFRCEFYWITNTFVRNWYVFGHVAVFFAVSWWFFFLQCASFIRFAFMSPDVWLFAVGWFFKLKKSEFAVLISLLKLVRLKCIDGAWHTDSSVIFIIFVPWRLFMDAAKIKREENRDDRIFADCRKTNHRNDSCMFAPRYMHVWTGSN